MVHLEFAADPKAALGRPALPELPSDPATSPDGAAAEPAGARDAAVVPPIEFLRYAASLVHRRVSTVAELALERLLAESPYYSDPVLSPPALREEVYIAMEVGVGSMAFSERFTEAAEFAWRLGRVRAEQGLPLTAVTHAFRIGAAAFWDRMVDAVMRDSPAEAHLLLKAAPTFWSYTDRETRLMAEAHRRVTEAIPDGESHRTRPVLEFLLRGNPDPLALSGSAVALDLPLYGRYAVAQLRGGPAADKAGGAVCEQVNGMRLLHCPTADVRTVVALLGNRTLDDLVAAVPVTASQRGGISPVVNSLAELGRARQLAELALDTCTADGEAARFDQRIPASLMMSRPDLATELATQVLRPVYELPVSDRETLLHTLAVWLDSGGSLIGAGRQLYCHRNTVQNRLRRLEELTGRSFGRPRDVVELTLALDAYRLRQHGPITDPPEGQPV